MNNKKPTFQPLDKKRSFKSESKKSFQKPSFSNKKLFKNTPRDQHSFSELQGNSAPITEEYVYHSSEQQGKVKVLVKSKQSQPYVKKTGPLSPRAPEKIKKNRAEEMKIYGENACLTLFSLRPESIVRAWATVEMSHRVGNLFSYLAKHKKVYHVVKQDELNKVSGSEHHGGICMLVKKKPTLTLSGYLQVARQQDRLVLLHQVDNPYNIGAIIRSCAFYGIKNIISTESDLLYSAACARVAEGGAELIQGLQTKSSQQALSELRQAGYQILHLSLTQIANATHISQLTLKNKVVLVLTEKYDESLVQTEDEQIRLSYATPLTTGLNIAVAAGIVLSRWE